MRKSVLLFSIITLFSIHLIGQDSKNENVIWKLGEDDNNYREFALAPDNYMDFLAHDFGWEDRNFIIGTSDISTDWPYALPGPADSWGGTSGTAGWRSSFLNILFDLKANPTPGNWKLIVDLIDCSTKKPPLLKISVNGKFRKYQLNPGHGILDSGKKEGKEFLAEIFLTNTDLRQGANEINITTLQGSWIIFDQIRLEGPVSELRTGHKAIIKNIETADYEISNETGTFQPLLIDIQHIKGNPSLRVELENNLIFSQKLETGSYFFEVPMPAVKTETSSAYQVFIDDDLIAEGEALRSPFPAITPAGYVNTMMGAAHSRWMIAPGPWMPFSMVKLSPDNQNRGWQSGYDPIFESIGGFSHIHEWTLSGLLTMPTTGPLVIDVGDQFNPDTGYRSRIDKSTEEAPLGYYKVQLTDYDIQAELTSTTRGSLQRYTFPKGKNGRILIDLKIPSEYWYDITEAMITRVNSNRIEGYSKQVTPNAWGKDITQEYIVHFVIEFDQPIIKTGTWTNNKINKNNISLLEKNPKDAGMYVEFATRKNRVVQMRTGISYVSIENAGRNLKEEISDPFAWDFEAVVDYNRKSWDEILSRINIQSNDRREKMRFYTNMFRSFCRNSFSDVDGSWVDPDENIQVFKDSDAIALGCDAFWNTFWNLNQLWNLAAPEWTNRWVNSQLAMYDLYGWLAKGPAGMEYIPVMVAEHEIPLIVGAHQMGITGFDKEKAFTAIKKMQTSPKEAVAGGFAGNNDLEAYLKYKYVPSDLGRFSNSLEYSFDDWTVSQMAKSLGKDEDYTIFADRGNWWKNVIDPESGFARMRDSEGNWEPDFDPYKSGANHHYVEGNAWQLTFFVPQDVPALARTIGKEKFIERLNWGFEESYKWRFNAPMDLYWDYPVIQGNQESMHFSFLFNWVGKPWLTQKWSRAILDRFYGYGLANAYLGDEDQGQMSAWFVMASMGLFQTDGGCRVDPIYEIGSPLFERIDIDLGNRFGRGKNFSIIAKGTSRFNKYVQSAKLNGEELNDFRFPASTLLQGGKLELEMGPEPEKNWGVVNEF